MRYNCVGGRLRAVEPMAPVRVEARTKEQSARDVRRIYADLSSSRVELRSIRGERLFRLGSPFWNIIDGDPSPPVGKPPKAAKRRYFRGIEVS